jgi:hypothetical protein
VSCTSKTEKDSEKHRSCATNSAIPPGKNLLFSDAN